MLGAVSAQYQFYSGVTPYFGGYAPYGYGPYAARPLAYAAHPATYAGYPYVHGLPLSFKPEEKAAEEAPAVEVSWRTGLHCGVR